MFPLYRQQRPAAPAPAEEATPSPAETMTATDNASNNKDIMSEHLGHDVQGVRTSCPPKLNTKPDIKHSPPYAPPSEPSGNVVRLSEYVQAETTAPETNRRRRSASSESRRQFDRDSEWQRNYEGMQPGIEIIEPDPRERRRRRHRRRESVYEANGRYRHGLYEREQTIDVTPGANEKHPSSPAARRAVQLLEPYTLEWHAERNRRIAAGMKVKFMDRCAEDKTPWVAGLGFPP
jgi:hypothetical protein